MDDDDGAVDADDDDGDISMIDCNDMAVAVVTTNCRVDPTTYSTLRMVHAHSVLVESRRTDPEHWLIGLGLGLDMLVS